MINSQALTKGKGMRFGGRGDQGGSGAESLAIQALSFLAGEPERLGRFLAVTGLGPENLRNAAESPGFLAGVLTYVAEDEALLMEFAVAADVPPERVAAAHRHLAGSPPIDDS
jgi:Protein of unknown function (DUF3572)